MKEPNDFYFDRSEGTPAGGVSAVFGYFLSQDTKSYSHQLAQQAAKRL